MGLIDERLERDRRIVGREAVRRRRARYKRTFTNAAPNFFREFLSIRCALCVIRFGRVSQEAAFHQHRRNGRFSQDVKAAASDAAIRAGCATGHVIMNRGSERQTLRTVKVSFDAARAPATRGIEVDTNEDRVPIGIGDRDARPQGHEDIAVSGHHDSIPIGSEHGFEPLGDVQSHGFFCDALTGNSAAIESAMASVDHHHGGRTVSFGDGTALRCATEVGVARGATARFSREERELGAGKP